MKEFFAVRENRIIIVVGHYGSGKTEFSVNLALAMRRAGDRFERMTLVDLDIVNPYFRSRERTALLEREGIAVCGGSMAGDITAEIPDLAAATHAPFEDEGCRTIADLGGNDSGARVLKQYLRHITPENSLVTAVINRSRPDTRDPQGALAHLNDIERECGLAVEAVVNNTHLLRETTPEMIAAGHELCETVCAASGRRLLCDCYPAPVVARERLFGLSPNLLPLSLHMRESWQDN